MRVTQLQLLQLLLLLLLMWPSHSAFDFTQTSPPTLVAFSGSISYSRLAACKNNCQGVYTFNIAPTVPPGFYSQTTHGAGYQAICSSISFVFSDITLPAAELSIYDTSPLNTFFTCISCHDSTMITSPQTVLVPPLFNSSTGSVAVRVSGTSTVSGLDSTFTLQYFCNVVYTTNAQVSDTRLISLRDVKVEMPIGYGTVRPMLSTYFFYNGGVPQQQLYLPGTANGQGTKQRFHITYTGIIRFAITMLIYPYSTCSNALSLKIYQSTDGNFNPQNQPLYDPCQSQWQESSRKKTWVTSNTGEALIVIQNLSPVDALIYFEIDFYVDQSLWDCGELLVPNLLVADSWILTDGSKSTSQQRRYFISNSVCEWLITPYTQSLVTLIYSWVSLKQGSRIIVYDNDAPSGVVLWDSGQIHFQNRFPGESFTTPPPLISSGNSLYVVYTTDPRSLKIPFYGFAATYVGNTPNSIGFGNSKATLSMSSAIDIVPPGNGSMYANNLVYTWVIHPISVMNYVSLDVGPITFMISELALPSGDTLSIYDSATPSPGSLIKTFSGKQLPYVWFKTSSSFASMQFKSNGDSHSGKVRVSYFSDGPNYHCGFTRNPATLTASSMILTDGSFSNETIYQNQLCQWIIAPQSAVGVVLTFNRYTLAGGTVSIFNGSVATGQLIATITDSGAVPAPILLMAPTMGLQYSTGGTVTGFGFSVSYFGIYTTRASKPGDGIIKILSSSMLSLTYASYDSITYNTTIKYLVKPTGTRGSIYFSVASLRLSPVNDCNSSRLIILDGDQTNVNATALKALFYADRNISRGINGTRLNFTLPDYHLKTFCGQQLPDKWIKASSSATILFSSATSNKTRANFDISYFSDGPSNHCGFPANPGVFNAASMILTDGSASRELLYPGADCNYLITPLSVKGGSGLVVLEFLENDLREATIEVHDGTAIGVSTLRWRCDSCTVVPRPIISRTGAFFLRYTSSSDAGGLRGRGFKATYWTLNSTYAGALSDTSTSQLEMPIDYRLSSSVNNHTTFWSLGVSAVPSQLSFFPSYQVGAVANITSRARDGRLDDSNFNSLSGPVKTCGLVTSLSMQPNALSNVNNSLFMQATQSGSYLSSSVGNKLVQSTSGSLKASVSSPGAPFLPSGVCKYKIDSGTSQSVLLTITQFTPTSGRLRIYGEVVPYQLIGNDALLFDSKTMLVPTQPILAWCGVATVILESTSESSDQISHALQMSYQINTLDLGTDCLNYKISLLPKVIKPDPLLPLYFTLGALAACCFSFVAFYHARRYLRKHWPAGGIVGVCYQRLRTYQVVTPRHLRYTPRLDELRNRFLPIGHCCVCQDDKLQVFYLDCNHALCAEDIKGYLVSALGDISMFPVKCPLHYEGCAGNIEANIAKRVLNRIEFDKFNEFSDRATYGEGMRCIFCDNFVKFPVEGARSMVECPYCIQRFCMRCKKSWHFGSRCPLDKVDDSLDAWRAESLAQKCPCCHKLIEKDDPDTCNHMVHKVTDGIPCLRDRTDFCYLCGEEVTPDYPHEETKNPGVNHFPDGVFQKCRKIAQKDRDSERERLKRLRRMKGKRPAERAVGFGFGILGADENNFNPEFDDDDENYKDDKGESSADAFDQQWNTALSSAKRASRASASPAGGSTPPSVTAAVTTPTARSSQRHSATHSASPSQQRSRAPSSTNSPTSVMASRVSPSG